MKIKIYLILAVVFIGVLASRTLLKHNYYFNMHDDLQMMRQIELEKCFKDHQIPCRWVPDMGYGYGLPLYNYYPQLPYLTGESFRLFSLPFNDVAKLTFALGIIASGITMFFLSSEFFGYWGGFLSSVFYVWAPYRAVDVYVRGAMNESWAWIWFPLILLFIYKLVSNRKPKFIIPLALSVAALLLTHNLMVLIFAPVAAVWALFWIFKSKDLVAGSKNLAFGGLLALCLSAFFTLPAVFEQKLVHIESLTSDYFQYYAHFTTVRQLFISRFWGDGPSIFGPNDTLAFPIGQVHWMLVLAIAGFLFYRIIKTKKITTSDTIAVFAIVFGTFAAFMTHERSTFIWKMIPTLKILQFPWRFLSLNVLGYSLAIGSVMTFFKKEKIRIVLLVTLSFMVIAFNWNYFKPVHGGPLTDQQKFSGEAWRLQTQAGIRDYLPIEAKDDPDKASPGLAEVLKGKTTLSDEKMGTNWAQFTVDGSPSTIRINIFAYPKWNVQMDGNIIETTVPKDEQWGRMYIEVPDGIHIIRLKLENTPLRTASNVISLVAWLGLLSLPLWGRKMLQSKRG